MGLPLTARIEGRFTKHLEERIAKWSVSRVAARVRVPPELMWLWWVEYGTAAQGDTPFASGHSYNIVPVSAKALAFPGPSGTLTITDHVDHPGIRPRRSIQKALPDIRDAAIQAVDAAFQAGAADNPSLLREAVVEAARVAKEIITKSLADNVPGSRSGVGSQDGKLHGETAASVFKEQATFVDVSEGE